MPRLAALARRLADAVRRDDYARGVSTGWSPPSDPPRPTLPLVLLVLSFTTGLIDAVSFLGLQRVFTAFQTGNVVTLGFALAGTEGFAALPPVVSLGSFVAGAAAGGRLAARLSDRHRRWFSMALGIEAALVALAAVIAMGALGDAWSDPRLLEVCLLAGAMGLRSATVGRLAAPDATTTVLTSMITGLAADLSLTRRGFARPAWQLATIASRLGGAVAGALLVRVSLVLPFVLVSGLIALAAITYLMPVVLRERRRRAATRSGA